MAAIRCPLLLVTGDLDRGAIISLEQVAQILAAQPRAHELRIPNAGHCIRYDQPQISAQRVGEWLWDGRFTKS